MDTEGEPVQVTEPTAAENTSAQVPVNLGGTSLEELPSVTEQKKKELINPRIISKNIDSEGREETARTIVEARSMARNTQESIREKEQRVQQIAEFTSTSFNYEIQKTEELTKRLGNIVVRVKNLVGIDDKKATELLTEVEALKSERSFLFTETYTIEKELEELKLKQIETPSPKQLLEAYYEKKSTEPLSVEQKKELLKPEILSNLSFDEYVALWKHLNPYFLSHVTRQGFRDHNEMIYHSSGLQEYHNGFLGIMNDGALIRPPLALSELKSRDEDSVKKWLGDWVFQGDEQEALARLNKLMNVHLASAPKYPDKTAVHFMAEVVGADYYGGESRNEVFFIFPSDVLASQYAFAFNGWEKDLTKAQSERKWNDVFVWPESLENPGIQVDAGLVFLPQTTPVDPETGSKYASQIIRGEDGVEKRVLVENETIISKYVAYFRETTGNSEHEISRVYQEYQAESNYYRNRDLEISVAQLISDRLTSIGVPSDSSFALARSMMGHMHDSTYRQIDDEQLIAAVRSSNAHYKRAENPIPAKQYWETFFQQHPESRPKRIVYYDGNPTQAVDDFLRDNDIGQANTAPSEGKLLGFDDYHVEDMDTDPRANNGKTELKQMAVEIIREHYSKVNNLHTNVVPTYR